MRQLRSHSKQRADELAYYHLDQLLRPMRAPVSALLAATEATTLDELRTVHAATFGAHSRLSARCLSYGNLDEAAGARLADALDTALQRTGAAALPKEEWAFSPVVQLEPGARWRLSLRPLSNVSPLS